MPSLDDERDRSDYRYFQLGKRQDLLGSHEPTNACPFRSASDTGSRNHLILSITAGSAGGVTDICVRRRKPDHCACFCASSANAPVSAKGVSAGRPVCHLANVAAIAAARDVPSKVNIDAISHRS